MLMETLSNLPAVIIAGLFFGVGLPLHLRPRNGCRFWQARRRK